MGGLIALAVAAAWVYLVYRLSRWVGHFAGQSWLRTTAPTACFVLMLPLPFLDEIIGRLDFRALCEERAVLVVDAARIRGKTVQKVSSQTFPLKRPIKIEQWTSKYLDATTNEELASITWLRASGGWLSRAFTESQKPAIFEDATCHPTLRDRIERVYEFNLVED